MTNKKEKTSSKFSEEKIEEEIEKKAKDFEKKAEAWGEQVEKEWSEGKRGKSAEYVATIVANIILISIWWRLPGWFPWITDSFDAVLPLFVISFGLTIAANFLFLFFRQKPFVSLVKTGLNAFSLAVLISLYYIYPFDFSAYAEFWAILVRILIILAIFGTAVATVVELIKTFLAFIDSGQES